MIRPSQNSVTKIKAVLPAPFWSFSKKCRRVLNSWNKKVPEGYRILANPNLADLKKKYENIWKDPTLPIQQLKVNARGPKNAPVYEIAVKLIKAALLESALQKPSVLEIGCSTGYYSDIFRDARLDVSYEGCDYSEAFIAKAKELHPGIPFKVEDATRLSYADTSFDIAISGCCILHIIDYDKAIAETARVAKRCAIFHRTPVLRNTKTTYAEKTGYGLPMFEIFFNEAELLELFRKNGMRVVAQETINSMDVPGLDEPVLINSYLCTKI